MFIDCMDIYGATTRVEFTVKVQEKVFSLSDVSSFASSATDAFKSGNLEEALSKSGAWYRLVGWKTNQIGPSLLV